MLFFPSLIHCSGISSFQPNSARLAAQIARYPHRDQDLSHTQFGVQGSYRLYKGWHIVASGLNLTNEVFGFYKGSAIYPVQREYYKPTASFGMRWSQVSESTESSRFFPATAAKLRCTPAASFCVGNLATRGAGASESLQSELHRRGAAAGIGPPRLTASVPSGVQTPPHRHPLGIRLLQ